MTQKYLVGGSENGNFDEAYMNRMMSLSKLHLVLWKFWSLEEPMQKALVKAAAYWSKLCSRDSWIAAPGEFGSAISGTTSLESRVALYFLRCGWRYAS